MLAHSYLRHKVRDVHGCEELAFLLLAALGGQCHEQVAESIVPAVPFDLLRHDLYPCGEHVVEYFGLLFIVPPIGERRRVGEREPVYDVAQQVLKDGLPDFDNGTPKLDFWWKKRFYC